MKLYKYIMLLPVGLMALSSCSDELSGTEWSAGEVSNAPGVYFSPDNETFMALLDGDGSVATLTVKRLDNKGELTVPVVVKKADENMVIPSTITFADGSYETVLAVDCATAPAITQLPIELTFPDEYINPYAAGAGEYAGSVIVSRWENVSETGLTDFTIMTWSYTDAGFNTIKSPLTHLLGSNRYRINSFLGTDIDFTFELVASPLKANYYRIVPVGNQLLLSDYGWGDYSYYNAWWLVYDGIDPDDEEEDVWPDIIFEKPDGSSMQVYYLQFLWYDEGTKSEYCYVLNYDNGTPTAYMAFYGNADEDMERYTTYYRLRFAWTESVAETEES